jgi:hypothetical protein
MAYEISPPIAFVTFSHGSALISPNFYYWTLPTGLRQKSQIAPPVLFGPLWRGERIPVSFQMMAHGVPGETTVDGEFPDPYMPQHRLNVSVPPAAPTYVVAYYHGEPGVLRGDDNWSQETPSYQPQLRTNTIPHTTDPVLVEGTWRVNECFLPQ